MAKARFEIGCPEPEIVKRAVEIENAHPITFITEPNALILEIEADTVKDLMKISYSICNRIQLAIETVEKFSP